MELGRRKDPLPSVQTLETDSEMEMCVQEVCWGVHRGTERPQMILQGPSDLSHILRQGGQDFVPSVSATHGRRETKLEGGSSLQQKAIPREGCRGEPSEASTPSTSR